jgi:iron complex transport system ATP-binding protein
MVSPLEVILSAVQYTFRVDGKALLDRVSFSIRAGARCAIIGPNGAGKSTLLKSFCRILPPGEGDLLVAGRSWRQYSQKELARWLAYVPQGEGRDSLFTVREFVLMGRYPYLSPFSAVRGEDWRAVDEALDRTGLRTFAGRRLDTLSGGERQKVLIAAALVQGARVLLLDEPTAFLDPYQQDQVHALLDDLHRTSGVTRVEVTHDVNRAALDHDQIIGLRAGRIVFDGTPAQLMRPEILDVVYGKRFTLTPHPADGRLVALPEVRG